MVRLKRTVPKITYRTLKRTVLKNYVPYLPTYRHSWMHAKFAKRYCNAYK